jgi:hypothetical protein
MAVLTVTNTRTASPTRSSLVSSTGFSVVVFLKIPQALSR